MRSVAYILPGHSENVNTKRYGSVVRVLRKKYVVKGLRKKWKTTLFSAYANQVAQAIRTEKYPVILVGFSFGAVAAFLASTKVPVEKVICCSLSPVFAEDQKIAWKNARASLPDMTAKQIKRAWGEQNLIDSRHLSAKKTLSLLQAKKYVFLMGAKENQEFPAMVRRAKWFAKKTKSRFITVPDAGHEISHPNYVNALRKLLKQ